VLILIGTKGVASDLNTEKFRSVFLFSVVTGKTGFRRNLKNSGREKKP
jgi:hypothetical protein